MESSLTRRDFLKSTARTTAGLGTLSGMAFGTRSDRIFGANDRVRVAVCGLHGRGKDHLDAFSHVPGVEIAALCDVDENVLRKRQGEVGSNPQIYIDVRKLLEDKSIDAISIATPNHWHALIAIWACQAGKDVYVEKPCSTLTFGCSLVPHLALSAASVSNTVPLSKRKYALPGAGSSILLPFRA
jgi:hypothetical protein